MPVIETCVDCGMPIDYCICDPDAAFDRLLDEQREEEERREQERLERNRVNMVPDPGWTTVTASTVASGFSIYNSIPNLSSAAVFSSPKPQDHDTIRQGHDPKYSMSEPAPEPASNPVDPWPVLRRANEFLKLVLDEHDTGDRAAFLNLVRDVQEELANALGES